MLPPFKVSQRLLAAGSCSKAAAGHGLDDPPGRGCGLVKASERIQHA